MRRLRKILKYLFLSLLVIALLVAAIGTWLVRRAWPTTEGTLAAPGLTAPVEVIRDRWGVPSLYAANEHDLFFAQGYVHAQDRLWQMEFNRRLGAGELASMLGPSLVPADKSLRALRIRAAAEADWQAADPATRKILEAYADGVNAFLKAQGNALPVEMTALGVKPAPWKPVDSLAWSKMLAFSLGQNQTQELMRAKLMAKIGAEGVGQIMPPYPGQERQPMIVSPEAGGYGAAPTSALNTARKEALEKVGPLLSALFSETIVGVGSNNWVVHGSRTATGKPMLANDTHLELNMPSVWYENGLHGGRFQVAGFSLPGVPMVLIGQNQRIAWGISAMCGDSEDFFEVGPNEPRQTIHESILVKGGKSVSFDIAVTPHGPILNEGFDLKGMPPLALRWAALDPNRTLDALAGMNLAGDWPAFRKALSNWGAPTLNFVYADVDGNIGYQAAGLIPIRAAGLQGLVPVPVGGPERDWRGYIPFESMPTLLNPAAGFIVTANNKVVGESYPYLISYDYADPYRAERISERLAALPKATREDMERLQGDVYSGLADTLRPFLLAVKAENPRQQKALDLVRDWDLEFKPGSPGATIYFAWYGELIPALYGDEVGDLMNEFRLTAVNQTPRMVDWMKDDPKNPWFDDKTTPGKVETRDDVVKTAFVKAIAMLSEKLGDDPSQWQWGKLHKAIFTHQPFGNSGIPPLVRMFNGNPVPVGGEAFSISSASAAFRRPFIARFGTTQRLVVDLSDLSRSRVVNSTGQSGLLFHRHRDDQIPLWRDHQYRELDFSREWVDKDAQEKLTLTPK